MLTGGQVPDCLAAEALLRRLPPDALVVIGEKGYDSNAVRAQIVSTGAYHNIPPRKNRRRKLFWDRTSYRNRNAIERMFGRLKDFRIATRYDRRADVFLSAVALAATVSH